MRAGRRQHRLKNRAEFRFIPVNPGWVKAYNRQLSRLIERDNEPGK